MTQVSERSSRSRDKGQYPGAEPSVSFEPKFREFLNLAQTPPELILRDAGTPVFDRSFRVHDPNISIASPDSSFKTPDTNLTYGSRSKGSNQGQGHFFRDRALTPPSTWDRNLSLTRDRKPVGFASSPPFSHNVSDHGLVPLPKHLSDIEESSRSVTQTDTSSTITSPPVTQHDIGTPIPSSRHHMLGHSPPVKDAGSFIPSLPLPTRARDKKLSFDLGFLDILTVDSNSSVVDQISTGRVSDIMVAMVMVFSNVKVT